MAVAKGKSGAPAPPMQAVNDLPVEVLSSALPTRVLLLHATDRWYLGDFLRHSVWLDWLCDRFTAATVDAASHPDYLALYSDSRLSRLLDARRVDPVVLSSYDLVVVPAASEPSLKHVAAPLVLASWDTGWALHIRGRRVLDGTKKGLNYFRAAHPSAVTGTHDFRPSHLLSAPEQDDAVNQALSTTFHGHRGPVIIYNPTSSNPFTRGTDVPKEVDNTLSATGHATLLRHLVSALPDHCFIVGSALKPDDPVNLSISASVAEHSRSDRVRSTMDLGLVDVTTLRGFASLLGSSRVCSAVGGGTGTNTHLASRVGAYSFSIERGADDAMLANWRRPTEFQMGSFRWRNPSVLAGVHTMNWNDKSPDALIGAAQAFLCHHMVAHGRGLDDLFVDRAAAAAAADGFERSWTSAPIDALRHARRLLRSMTAAACAHYGDFGDEAAYLRLRFGMAGEGLDALVQAIAARTGEASVMGGQLFEDSNLHKLLLLIGPQVARCSVVRRGGSLCRTTCASGSAGAR